MRSALFFLLALFLIHSARTQPQVQNEALVGSNLNLLDIEAQSISLKEVLDRTEELAKTVDCLKELNALKDMQLRNKDEELIQQREVIKKLESALQHRKQEENLQTQTASTEFYQPQNTNTQKRADDAGALELVINQLSQQVTQMSAQIQALQAKGDSIGTTYTRWGQESCPGTAELVYTGIVGGSHYRAPGGGSNYLCLHSNPNLDAHSLPNLSHNGVAEIYGSEYETCDEPECQNTPVCAVCRVPRSSTVVIPGTSTCSAGWTREYSGYLMSNAPWNTGNSEFICVDGIHEYLHTTQVNENQNLMYYTVFKCGSLPCPPYHADKLATCVVCSK